MTLNIEYENNMYYITVNGERLIKCETLERAEEQLFVFKRHIRKVGK